MTKAIGDIVGTNVRRLRTARGVSGDALARELRQQFEVSWTTARVSELENGRVSPTAPVLFMVSQALGALLNRHVSVSEILESPEFAKVGNVGIRASRVAAAFDGEHVELRAKDYSDADKRAARARDSAARVARDLRSIPIAAQDITGAELRRLEDKAGEAEQRAAKSLGIPLIHFLALSAKRWDGRTYSEERDLRAGPNANAQRRGQVGRELRKELQRALSDGNN